MIEPHGDTLIDRVPDEHEAERVESAAVDGPRICLDQSQYQDAVNISTGRFSPVKGFFTQNDFLKVVNDMTLEDGTVWPIPITLDVDAETAADLSLSEYTGLEAPDGELVGAIEVEEIYRFEKKETAKKVFGTDDPSHPGVEAYLERDDFLVGGEITMFETQRHNEYDLLPVESRVLFEHTGWQRVVGFQTRNAPHRAHEYIQKTALEMTDGLLVQPKLGEKKPGDYRDEVIMGAYRTLIDNYYPENAVALSVFPSTMRYAGPREAVFDAIVRKNQGCTHFIVGRDHAGVEDFYGEYDAQRLFREIDDIGITPLFFDYSFYCETCDGMASAKTCPHDDSARIYPSGSKIRGLIRDGDAPSERIMRPEVTEYVNQAEAPFVGLTAEAGGTQ